MTRIRLFFSLWPKKSPNLGAMSGSRLETRLAMSTGGIITRFTLYFLGYEVTELGWIGSSLPNASTFGC